MISLLFVALAHAQMPADAFRPSDKVFDRGTYFSVNLEADKFTETLRKAEKLHGSSLRTRGEEHLTVVTPPEYVKLSADQRKKLVEDLKNLDWSKPQIVAKCLGKGQVTLQGAPESTYFVVTEAPAIGKLRKKYGLGDFYPHVTVGFTKRDLHFEDGVRKDPTSCVSSL